MLSHLRERERVGVFCSLRSLIGGVANTDGSTLTRFDLQLKCFDSFDCKADFSYLAKAKL